MAVKQSNVEFLNIQFIVSQPISRLIVVLTG
ncbi:hypothetical protein predicted by Glimmer/Critica [Lactiplantibacillus plantarum]|nr:hypothetical protein predicted by Glimmer/Critica [Lactiplantibacillus plantarum]